MWLWGKCQRKRNVVTKLESNWTVCYEPHDRRPLNPTVPQKTLNLWNSWAIENISALRLHLNITGKHSLDVCASVYVGVGGCLCAFCPDCAVYSRDFSHGNLVYLLYLRYNASLNISNFETQVSISRVAAACACPYPVLSQVRRRDEHRRQRDGVDSNPKVWQRGLKIIQNKNGQRVRMEKGNKRIADIEEQGGSPEKIKCIEQWTVLDL